MYKRTSVSRKAVINKIVIAKFLKKDYEWVFLKRLARGKTFALFRYAFIETLHKLINMVSEK